MPIVLVKRRLHIPRELHKVGNEGCSVPSIVNLDLRVQLISTRPLVRRMEICLKAESGGRVLDVWAKVLLFHESLINSHLSVFYTFAGLTRHMRSNVPKSRFSLWQAINAAGICCAAIMIS